MRSKGSDGIRRIRANEPIVVAAAVLRPFGPRIHCGIPRIIRFPESPHPTGVKSNFFGIDILFRNHLCPGMKKLAQLRHGLHCGGLKCISRMRIFATEVTTAQLTFADQCSESQEVAEPCDDEPSVALKIEHAKIGHLYNPKTAFFALQHPFDFYLLN